MNSKRGIKLVIKCVGVLWRKGVVNMYGKVDSVWGIILNWLSVLLVSKFVIFIMINNVFSVSRMWIWKESGFIERF